MNIGYEFNYVLSCGCPYAAIAPRQVGGWVTCFPHGEVTVVSSLGGDVAQCCRRFPVSRPGAVCQDGAGCKKPHLRLRHHALSPTYPWSVEYVRGPNGRCRRETFNHTTVHGALASAYQLWFANDWARRVIGPPVRKS